jgi:protein TonB
MQRWFPLVGVFAFLSTSWLAAQDVYRVSDQIAAPTLVEVPKPTYLPMLVMRGISGVVGLEVDVMQDGTVGTVALVKSVSPQLDQAAIAAVRQFKFSPGTKDGNPVAVRIPLNLEFSPGSKGAWQLSSGAPKSD